MKYIADGALSGIKRSTAITIGNFDGLHRGHRKLISRLKECADKYGLESIVFSFTPHPLTILRNNESFRTILSPEEKRYLLSQLDIDTYLEYPFNKEFAELGPQYFAEEILFRQMHCKALIVGEGYRFGHEQQGTVRLLKEIGAKYNAQVFSVAHETYEGNKISSSSIRDLILRKELDLAEKYLTTPYFVIGQVLHGKRLGRQLGFPTVNLVSYEKKLSPPNGMYFTKTYINGTEYKSITNVGNNPTFEGHPFVIETYLFGFDQEVYGETIKVDFYKYLRGEMKFDSVEGLQKQILQDIEKARAYFNVV